MDSKYNGLKIYFFMCCKKAKYDKYKNKEIIKSIKYYNYLKNDPPQWFYLADVFNCHDIIYEFNW